MRTGSPARDADKKDPAVVTTEKLMHAILTGDCHAINVALDPTITFQSPMGTYVGRPYVKPWIEFEVALLRPYEHLIRHHCTVAEDGLKVGKSQWSIGGLHFTDTVTQTPLLTIRHVKRTIRRDCKTQADHDIAEALLLAWTGPHFSKFCAPPSKGHLDNRAIILPVLDYSFKHISNVRGLLSVEPTEASSVADNNIVFHFLAEAVESDKAVAEAKNAEAAQAAGAGDKQKFGEQQHAAGGGKKKAGTITIQAKNRSGEVNAIIIDKSTLEAKGGEATRLDALEDAELQIKRDRNRFVCSGLRLANNELQQARELDHIARLFLVNAFYFVTMVDLSSNRLTEIPELSQLLSLQTLYLHDNKIADWKQLETLQLLPQLNGVTLFGNPIQQQSESAKSYKFHVLYFFYSPNGFRCFPSRQQTLHQQAAAAATSAASRPASRANLSSAGSGPLSRGRSPSPALDKSRRAPTPALVTRVAVDSVTGEVSSGPTLAKIRLRMLDHATISPLEVETLEQFLPVLRRKLKRACSPPRDPAAGKPPAPLSAKR